MRAVQVGLLVGMGGVVVGVLVVVGLWLNGAGVLVGGVVVALARRRGNKRQQRVQRELRQGHEKKALITLPLPKNTNSNPSHFHSGTTSPQNIH